jgi:4-amino-4-deoxy-L-arabinose transferase
MSSVNIFLRRYGSVSLLFLFFITAYLVPLDNRLLITPDEMRYAEISREMLLTEDWVVPKLLGMNYFEKPVAGYWLNNISQLLFGETRFAVRFASAFCTGMTALLIFWFTLQLFQSHKKAFAATACYLSCLMVYTVGVYNVLDGIFTFWVNLCVIAFYCGLHTDRWQQKRNYYLLTGAAAGLAFLTKGFIGFLIPAIVVLPYLLYRRQLNELKYLWIAILSLLIVCLPWTILIHLRAPDYWSYFFWEEHIKRFAAEDAQHKAPFFYYVPVMLLGLLPWVGLLPSAIAQVWAHMSNRSSVIFIGIWALLPIFFFSLSKGKLPTYVLMCFAPVAILVGAGLVDVIEKKQWRAIRINAGINILFGILVALLVYLIASGHVGHNTYYDTSEQMSIFMLIGIFIFWALMGALSYFRPEYSVMLTMLCPLAFALLLSFALPRAVIYTKQPESFINEHKALLEKTRIVLSDDPGLAVSLAWVLKRIDIRLYGFPGELTYGLQTSKLTDQSVSAPEFPAWLQGARQQNDVLVMTRKVQTDADEIFRSADKTVKKYGLSLYYFKSTRLNGVHE